MKLACLGRVTTQACVLPAACAIAEAISQIAQPSSNVRHPFDTVAFAARAHTKRLKLYRIFQIALPHLYATSMLFTRTCDGSLALILLRCSQRFDFSKFTTANPQPHGPYEFLVFAVSRRLHTLWALDTPR